MSPFKLTDFAFEELGKCHEQKPRHELDIPKNQRSYFLVEGWIGPVLPKSKDYVLTTKGREMLHNESVLRGREPKHVINRERRTG